MSPKESGRAKILVVDDDQFIATSTSMILKAEGYEVATAFSGEEAVEKAKTFCPDLLLSDIWMDSMNGIEAAVRISAKRQGVKILFLSGDATMLDVLMTYPKRIVYSLMLKPARVPDLLNAIAYLLPRVETTEVSTSVEIRRDSSQFPADIAEHHDPAKKFPVRSVDYRDHDQDAGRRAVAFR